MAYDASARISFPAVLWASVAISYCFYLFTGVIRMHHLSEEIESLERRERITEVNRADALLNKLKIKLSLKKLSDRSYLQQLFSLLLSCIFKLKASNGNHLNTPCNKGSPS